MVRTMRFVLKYVYEIAAICAKLQSDFFYRWMKPNYLTLLASVVNRIQPECLTFSFFLDPVLEVLMTRVPNFCIKAK